LDFLTLLQEAAQGLSRRDLAERAGHLSAAYRRNDPSAGAVRAVGDEIAYALSRAPATYAAVSRVFDELATLHPDFAPGSMLDLGAGPGTATWAAADQFASITDHVLVDHNPRFLELARSLCARTAHPALANATVRSGDLGASGMDAADLVALAYALTELTDARYTAAVDAAWARTAGALVLVEPGRPRDYQRLMEARARLIAAGGVVLAPCPHQAKCPLVAPDWCHFSVRLERSRDHQALKGARLGYEDEKFSYLVVLRDVAPQKPDWSRVLAPPEETKFSVDLALCTPEGERVETTIRKRTPAVFKAAKKLRWGDRYPQEGL
jgi:ribosomal protein RSM22 (predicted rRNA methylase)